MGDVTKTTQPSRRWPLWLFVAVCLIVEFASMPLLEWLDLDFGEHIFALIILAGAIVGQCCFVAVVAGLTQRSWVGAFLFVVTLAVAGVVATFGGMRIVNDSNTEFLSGVALVPLFVLAAATPLYGLRRWFGWRLCYSDTTPIARQPHGLADIFAQVAIVATVLVMARVPQVVMENDIDDHWVPLTITCLVMFGTSLVVLPLHIRIVFGSSRQLIKGMWLTLLPLIYMTLFFGIVQCFSWNQSWSQRLELLPYEIGFFGTAIAFFYGSLWALVRSGMVLVRVTKLQQPTSDKDDMQARLQRLTWWRIGGAIAVTTSTNIALANLQQWRAFRDAENTELEEWAESVNGHVGINNRIPETLILGAKATDADLKHFRVCSELDYLEFKNCKVTDAALAELKYYPNLETLVLRGVNITDEGLLNLRHLSKLDTLEIKDCQVTGSSLHVLPTKDSLVSIDFSRTQFGDDQSELLVKFPKLYYVALNNTRVTGRSLASLGQLPELTSLELRGTDIVADHFPLMPKLNYIDLDKTNANDAMIESLAKTESLWHVSLCGTKITNLAIEALSSLPFLYHLDVSETRIDDDAVANLARANSMAHLDLAGTNVTGSGFAKWPAKSRSFDLILDRCPVDDDGVGRLIAIGEFDNLSLAKTSITDDSLLHLAQASIENLDLCETEITFKGLLTNGVAGVTQIHVESGRFTSQQISQLEKQLRIDVRVAKKQ